MNERVMLDWVDTPVLLRPCALNAPDGIQPLLILDWYHCHMLDSVKNAISAIGVQLQIIPGGCTCLCQPVDVRINKPLKHLMQEKWLNHHLITNRNQAVNSRVPTPSHEEM